MAYRLVSFDSAVTVANHGPWATAGTTATTNTVTLRATSVRVENVGDPLQLSAIGDRYKYVRPGPSSWRANVEMMIPSDGPLDVEEGDVVTVYLQPLASTTTTGTYAYTGVVDSMQVSVDTPNVRQTISLTGPVEGF